MHLSPRIFYGFSKFWYLDEATMTYYPFLAKIRCWRHGIALAFSGILFLCFSTNLAVCRTSSRIPPTCSRDFKKKRGIHDKSLDPGFRRPWRHCVWSLSFPGWCGGRGQHCERSGVCAGASGVANASLEARGLPALPQQSCQESMKINGNQ